MGVQTRTSIHQVRADTDGYSCCACWYGRVFVMHVQIQTGIQPVCAVTGGYSTCTCRYRRIFMLCVQIRKSIHTERADTDICKFISLSLQQQRTSQYPKNANNYFLVFISSTRGLDKLRQVLTCKAIVEITTDGITDGSP